jgi:hypothetical protein
MHIARDPEVAKTQRQLLRKDFIALVNERHILGGATTVNEALKLSLECLSSSELVKWLDYLCVRWHVTELEDDQT